MYRDCQPARGTSADDDYGTERLGVGTSVGSAVGAALGGATNEVGRWLPMGVALGVAFGSLWGRSGADGDAATAAEPDDTGTLDSEE